MSAKSTQRSIQLPRTMSARLWVAYAVALVVLGLGALSALPKDVRSVMEGLVLGLAGAALVTHPSITPVLLSTSRRARFGAGCLALALVIAHVAKVTGYTFPFVDWRMFGRSSEGQPSGLRFTAMRADGSSERIVLGAAISDATVSRLDGMVRKYLASNARDQLDQVVSAAVKADSLDSPRSPIVSVIISECVATIENPVVTHCQSLQAVSVNANEARP